MKIHRQSSRAIAHATALIFCLSVSATGLSAFAADAPPKPAAVNAAGSPPPSPKPAASSADLPPVPSAPAAPAEPPPPVYKDGVVKIGNDLKRTIGKVTDVEKGDNGCYLTLMDDKKFEFIEIGVMELCTQKPPLKGKKVELVYKLETIQASSCYGDPKCKKTETVPLVIKVNSALVEPALPK